MMSATATIIHDDVIAISLVYVDGALAGILPCDAMWEEQLGALLESVDSAEEYVLAPGNAGLCADSLSDVPPGALDPVPDDHEWSAEALGEAMGLAVTWTIVTGADFIFGEEGDPFGLF